MVALQAELGIRRSARVVVLFAHAKAISPLQERFRIAQSRDDAPFRRLASIMLINFRRAFREAIQMQPALPHHHKPRRLRAPA